MVLPRRPDKASAARVAELTVVRVLEFSHELLRSGAVVITSDAPKNSAMLFMRGAPSVIQSFVEPTSIPEDFEQVTAQLLT